MFDTFAQYRDWMELSKAQEEAPAVPCTNYPDAWFPEFSDNGLGNVTDGRMAAKMCKTQCPIREACLIYGIKWETSGIWGGLTPKERQRLRGNKAGRQIGRRIDNAVY